MTQEEKELLFKDLSARLPYHVRCKIWLKDGTTEEGLLDLEHNYGNVLQDAFYYNKIKDIKPYLRPISSMTEEEVEEYFSICTGSIRGDMIAKIDFYIKHHFDFRLMSEGLSMIETGLALEAPEGMYKNK